MMCLTGNAIASMNCYLNGKGHTVQPMSEDDYNERVTFLKMLNSGSTSATELRKTYPSAYDSMKRYELIVFGTSEKLVFKADATVPLDKRKQVLHCGNIFNAIYAIHTGAGGNGYIGHRMAKTFHKSLCR
jgi:hypothetical protein